ncbi:MULTISPECIES: hypothetical protein [unclassified Mameliella]|uniref:hypothetical protein n=1 Tax=unclassified Mameliella TaxID=2630630 RepID=UPI00273D656E|nr:MULTISPECIES: hypothetical protein [unclassified Mameliella]
MMAYRGIGARAVVRAEGVGRCGQPIGPDGRERVSVRLLLEWAFDTEKARLEIDDVAHHASGMDSTRRIMEAMQLSTGLPGSCLRVDAGGGRSLPHHDAEIVVSVLRRSVPWSVAVQVAEMARTRSCPRWDIGPQRMVPRAWGNRNRHGVRGKTEKIGEVLSHRPRRGVVREPVLWTPVTVEPTASQIAAARRRYLDWRGALMDVQAGLRGVSFDLFELTDALPALAPWSKRA